VGSLNKVGSIFLCAVVALGAAMFATFPHAGAQEQPGAAKAAFNLDRVDGAQFMLVRPLPLLDAGDVIEITPALADPSRPLGALQIAAEKPRRRDPPKTVLTSASVEPTAKEPRAGLLPIEIKVSNIKESGTFELPIQLFEPGLPPQRFSIILSAGDAIILPAIVILLGVAASVFLRRLAESYEPRQLLLATIHDLREDLRIPRSQSSDPAIVQEIDHDLEVLRRAENVIETEDLAKLRTEINGVEQRYQELRTKRTEKAIELAESAHACDEALRNERLADPGPTDTEEAEFNRLHQQLESIVHESRSGQIDDAADRLRTWRGELAGLRHQRLRRLSDALASEPLQDGTPEAEIEQRKELHVEVRALLQSGKLDEAAAKLLLWSNLVTRRAPVLPQALRRPAGRGAPEPIPTAIPPPPSGRGREQAESARGRARLVRRVIEVVSVLLTTISGLGVLYFGKPFGGVDYILAVLWGFGMDNAVHGAGDVLTRLTGGAPKPSGAPGAT
jgi:hypothetical protein